MIDNNENRTDNVTGKINISEFTICNLHKTQTLLPVTGLKIVEVF